MYRNTGILPVRSSGYPANSATDRLATERASASAGLEACTTCQAGSLHDMPGWKPKLLPFVDENFPTCHAFEFQNAALEPGVVLQFCSHFIFIFRVDDQESATREARFIEQGAAHHNETSLNEFIDEGRMLVPERLLTRALRWIA